MTYHVFVGYDDREHEAYLVAKHSLEKHATVPIKIHKLHHKILRGEGLFTREATIVGKDGQYIDKTDGRPFSTQFTFTRFLMAELWRRDPDEANKSPLIMFVDCDFIFLEDIGLMFKEIEEAKSENSGAAPVYCVKHDYNPQNVVKMDWVDQTNYNMKLWAAMMVLDMDHPDNSNLTPELVNTAVGRDLMNFCWVEDVDTICGIDGRWQFIPGHSEKQGDEPSVIHWTEGGPYFSWYRDECGFADVWFEYYGNMLKEKLAKGEEGLKELVDG